MTDKGYLHQPCLCCSTVKNVEFHLITSYYDGSGPAVPENMAPVSKVFNRVWHERGTVYMAETFPRVKKFLLDNGWQLFDGVNGRYWTNRAMLKEMVAGNTGFTREISFKYS